MTSSFETYITDIEKDYRGGKATELNYRSALENFMEALERGIEAQPPVQADGVKLLWYFKN
jgi:hypothetical protein